MVSWSYRGLGGSQKIEVIKRIKLMEHNSILLIQETKKTVVDNLSSMKKLWPKGEGFAISVSGASGGFLTWWDNEKFSLQTVTENKNWLFVKLKNKENKEAFWVKNIYGPMTQAHKEIFWNSLEEQCEGKKQTLCFVAGNFNVTIFADERRGGVKVRDPFGERLEDLATH